MIEQRLSLQGMPPEPTTEADAFADELAEILYSHNRGTAAESERAQASRISTGSGGLLPTLRRAAATAS
jgi:hypothetical protein